MHSLASILRQPRVVLFAALFASQAGLLVLSPILPDVARELGVSTATAGQLRTLSGATGGGDIPLGSFNLNMNLNYRWQFGKPVSGPGGIGVIVNGGAVDVRQVEAPGRFSVGFFMFANNLTNHANYVGYSGVMTSPYFRQATAVTGTRRVQAGLQFLF